MVVRGSACRAAMHVTQVDPEPVEARDNEGAVMTAPFAQGGRHGASNLRQERMDTQRPGRLPAVPNGMS